MKKWLISFLNQEVTWKFKRYQVAFIALAIALACLICGCSTPKAQKGGASIQSEYDQLLVQPDNPDGKSEQTIVTETTIEHPDGRKEKTKKETRTVISGSQDYGKIIKEWAKAKGKENVIFMLVTLLIAFGAWKNGWPLVSMCFGASAFIAFYSSIFWAWIPLLAGVCLYLGFKLNFSFMPNLPK